MKYSTSDIKNGLKILVDGEPCIIIENEFEKPGKGQAFTRVKIKRYLSGKVLDRTYKSGQTLIGADIQEQSLQFLYQDGDQFHFMNPDTYEQVEVNVSAIQEAQKWLKEQSLYQVVFWDGRPVSVTPENFMLLKVTECDPNVKGNSQSGVMKNATLETGVILKVPLFIKQDDVIKVDTRTQSYVERASQG